jgi:hypothetical protein
MRGHGRLSLWVRLLQRVTTLAILAIVVVEMHLRVQPPRGPVALGPPSPREVHVVVIARVNFEEMVAKVFIRGLDREGLVLAGACPPRKTWQTDSEKALAQRIVRRVRRRVLQPSGSRAAARAGSPQGAPEPWVVRAVVTPVCRLRAVPRREPSRGVVPCSFILS